MPALADGLRSSGCPRTRRLIDMWGRERYQIATDTLEEKTPSTRATPRRSGEDVVAHHIRSKSGGRASTQTISERACQKPGTKRERVRAWLPFRRSLLADLSTGRLTRKRLMLLPALGQQFVIACNADVDDPKATWSSRTRWCVGWFLAHLATRVVSTWTTPK